jgi:hypothetical protein
MPVLTPVNLQLQAAIRYLPGATRTLAIEERSGESGLDGTLPFQRVSGHIQKLGWNELGHAVELGVHIEPQEPEDT